MAQPSSLNSNNPFRRNGPSASIPTPVAAPPPPLPDALDSPSDVATSLPSSDRFRAQLQTQTQTIHPPPATSFQKPKVVKKVRVQSPPPSSPESAGAPDDYSRYGPNADESSSSDDENEGGISNPFNITLPGNSADDHDRESSRENGGEDFSSPIPHRAPPNPFQRTLQDLELGTNEVAQSAGSPVGMRGALDVDAFKRLLLTGQAGGPGAAQIAAPASASVPTPHGAHPTAQTSDGASLTDTSSISRQSIFDATYPSIHDTPRTSHEISEPEGDDDRHGLIGTPRPKAQSPTTLRKKPPPPSSRHGKLIKVELKGKDKQEGNDRPSPALPLPSMVLPEPTSPLEVNKPLPPAPHRHPIEEEAESIFDREAAGKVPEPAGDLVEEPLPIARPPTPPKAASSTPTSATSAQQPIKKPPPPPRRHHHGRSESKASIVVNTPALNEITHPDELDTLARRSSQDSTRSRSSSLRVSIHAPAPPPPRRPTHNSRSSNSFISPSAVSFSSITSASSDRSPSEGVEFSPLPTSAVAAISSSNRTSSPHGEASGSATEASTATPSPLHLITGQPKLFPPPPPPARNASTRSKRPPSVSSLDVTPRRVGGPLPPPPPPRQRGSSKGSVDGSGLAARKGSVDGVRVLEGRLAEEPASTSVPVEESSAAPDILADLTALQREVDALRGKVQKG